MPCKKNWIAGAIKKKGSLRKTLGAKKADILPGINSRGSKVRILSAVASLGVSVRPLPPSLLAAIEACLDVAAQ